MTICIRVRPCLVVRAVVYYISLCVLYIARVLSVIEYRRITFWVSKVDSYFDNKSQRISP